MIFDRQLAPLLAPRFQDQPVRDAVNAPAVFTNPDGDRCDERFLFQSGATNFHQSE
jgi:hypothetical protein